MKKKNGNNLKLNFYFYFSDMRGVLFISSKTVEAVFY